MAVRFSASGQHYQATTGLPTTVYTITAWVWATDLGSRYRVVHYLRQSSGDHYTAIQVRNLPTDIQLSDDVSYAFGGVGPLAISPATWYRVAAVVNGANATFYSAAAGDPLTSASVADFSPPATPNQLWIGADPFSNWWDGRFAAIKMWDAALTASEVEQELGQYQPLRTTNLLRWHPLINAEVTDYSGNGNTLTGGTGATTEDGPPLAWGSAIPVVILPPSETSGTLTATLPQITASMTATVTSAGALNATLPPLTASMTATVVDAATLSATLPALTATASASVVNPGTLTATLPALQMSMSDAITAGRLGGSLLDTSLGGTLI
ncbi:LamG domain-containing protein [Nonomuraea sp. NPDC026600]|uniref:LamG domain-containing protein n=1 Tax=Nonomuraea sp. NPDC026600 TaxID=3155363 RepID=UPI0033C034AA